MPELKSRPTHNEPSAPVGLADLVQLAEMGGRSERVRVRRGATEGVVYIDQGVVVHAYFGNLTGEAAAQAIFKQAEQPASRLAFEEPDVRSMQLRPSQLLLTFAVEADELTRHEGPGSRRSEGSVPPPLELGSSPGTGKTPGTGMTPGTGKTPGTGMTPGSASFRTGTGSGRSSPGSASFRSSPGSGQSAPGSFKTRTSSDARSGSVAQRRDGSGWLWRAFTLFCLAGAASYSYFKFVVAPDEAQNANANQVQVVQAEDLKGMTDVVPRLIQAPPPKRPKVETALQPTVQIRALVGADGTVQRTEVVDSRRELRAFEQAALQAVKKYRFKPAQRSGQVVAAWLNVPVSFASASETASVTLRGSLGFQPFAKALSKALEKRYDTSLDFDMDGAAPCISTLLEGEADVCINTRSITKAELEVAKAIDVELQEHVLGLAHAAIVVNSQNPMSELSLFQLSALYRGNYEKWSSIYGGEDLKVGLLGMPSDSLAADVFRDSVLTIGGTEAEFSPKLQHMADTQHLFSRVAKGPGAIAFASTQAVDAHLQKNDEQIKLMPIAAAKRVATVPTAKTIAQRKYPIRGQVKVYARAAPDKHTYELLSLLFSKRGRAMALQNDVAPGRKIQLPPFKPPPDRSEPEVFHVQFIAGSVGLDVAGRLRLDQVALLLAESEKRWAVVVGHADPVSEPSQQDHLARKRAEAVERYLTSGGLGKGRVEVFSVGARRPVTGERDRQSQYKNRRVDIFVVERGS